MEALDKHIVKTKNEVLTEQEKQQNSYRPTDQPPI